MKKVILMAVAVLAMGVGCKKGIEGYEKVFVTATINGQSYKESATWYWNQQQRRSTIALYEHYKVFRFFPTLEKEGDVRYEIQFYIAVDEAQFKTNYPYKIDFYNMDIDEVCGTYVSEGEMIPYVSENREQVLAAGADGMAFAISDFSKEPVPLKGEFTIETIDPKTQFCKGSFSLTSSGNDSEKLTITGKILEVQSSIRSTTFRPKTY